MQQRLRGLTVISFAIIAGGIVFIALGIIILNLAAKVSQSGVQNSLDNQTSQSGSMFVKAWGSKGSDEGQFLEPAGVSLDSSGNVYVSDFSNNRIQKFTSNGTFITKWGSSGSGEGQFDRPENVAVDSSGNVYVGDTSNNRIQVFRQEIESGNNTIPT